MILFKVAFPKQSTERAERIEASEVPYDPLQVSFELPGTERAERSEASEVPYDPLQVSLPITRHRASRANRGERGAL